MATVEVADEREQLKVMVEDVDSAPGELTSPVSPSKRFTLYKQRWYVMVSFFLFNLMQCISWMSVSVLATTIQQGFDVKTYEVNMTITLQQIFLIPGFVLSAWLYNHWELRTIQMISCLMTLFGGWLRMLVLLNGNFWWIVIGSTIVGSAAPFQMGGLSIIANYWFGDQERGKATAIMTVSNPLGMLVGFTIQGIYGHRIHTMQEGLTKGTPEYDQVIRENIDNMYFMENILISICAVYFFVFFTASRPPTPPSYVAMRNHSSITQGLKADLGTLLSNKNYLLIMTVFSLMYCVYAGFGIFLDYIFSPFFESTELIASIAVLFVLFGSIASWRVGGLLDRTGKYLLIFRMILLTSTCVMGFSLVALPLKSSIMALVWAVLGGVFIVPIVPVTFNFITETTHPLAPALVLNVTLIVANAVLTIYDILGLLILQANKP